MNEFKVGDKVVMIDGVELIVGTICTVTKIINDNYVMLAGFSGDWESSRFGLYQPDKHVHCDFIIQAAKDTTIKWQCRKPHDIKWISCGNPRWDINTEYRVEPKLVTAEMLRVVDEKYCVDNDDLIDIFTKMYETMENKH